MQKLLAWGCVALQTASAVWVELYCRPAACQSCATWQVLRGYALWHDRLLVVCRIPGTLRLPGALW